MTQLQRFQETLSKSDFDAALISSGANRRYLCDFDYSDGYIVVGTDKAFLITDSRYEEAARNAVTSFEIVISEGAMADTVIRVIEQNGYTNIAVEEASLSCKSFASLKAKLQSERKLASGASEMLSTQRAIKLPHEIERIKRAQQITDQAFWHVLSLLSTEMTERDVALELEFFMRKNGAEAVAFNTIAVSGSASSMPHGVPSDVKLRQGFLTMDFGAKYKGYCSDMTRTVVIGRADDEMKRLYNTVLSAQTAAIEQIKGGMLCRDADGIARSIIREAGYGDAFSHSLGHGVGIDVHEKPSLSQKAAEDSRLLPGNVVTVEPGIYLEGKYGCRIEDMIAINQDGSVYNFTASPKNLIEI